MKKAIIYLRISSDRQIDNTSLDTQEEITQSYCKRELFEVIAIQKHEAVSAKETNEKRVAELLEFVKSKQGKFEVLVVFKLDRFARSQEQHHWLRGQLMKLGVILRSATERIDESPSGRLVEGVLAAVNEYDNAVRKERVKIALWRRVEEGYWPWQPPVGYYRPHRLDIKAPLSEWDESCYEAAREVFELYSTGVYTLNMISKHMNKKKVKNHAGKIIKFPNQLIHKMLHSVFYIGYLKNQEGKLIKAQHKPLISNELWEKCQRVMNKQSHNIVHKRHYYSPDFPLRRFVICTFCSSPLTACWSQGRTEKYPYYYCRTKGCKKYGKMIPRNTYTPKKPTDAQEIIGLEDEFYEYLKQVKPKEEWIQVFNDVFITRYEQRKQELNSEYFSKIDEIKQLEQEQKWLVERGQKGIIPDNLLKKQLEDIDQKMTLAQMNLNDTYVEKIEVEALLAEAYTFCRTPEIAWYNALPEAKVKYQRLIFPQGIYYDGDSLSNRKLGLPFKLIRDIATSKSTDVGDQGVEPCASFLSGKRSTDELITLSCLYLRGSERRSSTKLFKHHEARGGIEPPQSRFCRPLRFHFATEPPMNEILP